METVDILCIRGYEHVGSKQRIECDVDSNGIMYWKNIHEIDCQRSIFLFSSLFFFICFYCVSEIENLLFLLFFVFKQSEFCLSVIESLTCSLYDSDCSLFILMTPLRLLTRKKKTLRRYSRSSLHSQKLIVCFLLPGQKLITWLLFPAENSLSDPYDLH